MHNIKLIIEYDGRNYSGWQIQRSPTLTGTGKKENKEEKKTIQGVLEKTLAKIVQEKVKVIASGRTDAGVHAKGQVANVSIKSEIPLQKLKKAINSNLPEDIVIKKIDNVPDDFHSRFSAKSKIYRYQICQGFMSCFDRFYFTYVPYKLDINLMKKEAKTLIGRHDFKSFQGSRRKAKDTVRTIKNISLRKKGRYIFIDIEADGFLYNMVRNIIGTLIEIARGRFPAGSMRKILNAKNRTKAGPTASSKGLFLMQVKY